MMAGLLAALMALPIALLLVTGAALLWAFTLMLCPPEEPNAHTGARK